VESSPRVLCFATQGSASGDEQRIVRLLQGFQPDVVPFDRRRKLRSAISLMRHVHGSRPALVVMEGTGVAGGVPLLLLRALNGQKYVVSSGDAVGPFIAAARPVLRPFATAYEWLLCRGAAGFVAWTPYLAGRALTMGARRTMTAAGFDPRGRAGDRAAARRRLGIPDDALVFGLVGSLGWNARRGYCYGLELVSAAALGLPENVWVVVVGDGDGRAALERIVREHGLERVVLPGRVTPEEIPDVLAAFDVGSLPQSVDGVGAFRYTIKLSEYLSARLPIVTGQIPLAYDLDRGWLWRLPGDAPWDRRYVEALHALMGSVDRDEVQRRRDAIPADDPTFDEDAQRSRVEAFVGDLLADGAR
jgi:glycosyltransferase involved in cell wall biosynthesis